MNKADVSIIIPLYNVANYITDCLNSVICQSSQVSIECIIIDDCSQDNSLSIVRQFVSKQESQVKFRIFTHSCNQGQAAARNTGIHQASGKYLFFLDSDDILPERAIEYLWERALNYPDADFIQGDIQTFPNPGMHLSESIYDKNFPEYSDDVTWIRSVFLTIFPTSPCSRLIKKDFIIQNGLFFREGIIHEDSHWQILAYHHITKIAFLNKVTYLYRVREGSTMRNKNFEFRRLDALYLIFQEFLSREVTDLDRPWSNWIVNSLNRIRSYQSVPEYARQSKKYLKSLSITAIRNTSLPICMRIQFALFLLPSCLFSERLLYLIYNRYLTYKFKQ